MGDEPQASPVPVGNGESAKAAGQVTSQCIASSTSIPEGSHMRDADCKVVKAQSLRILKTLGEARLQDADAFTKEGDSDPSEVEEGSHANTTSGKHIAFEVSAEAADGRANEAWIGAVVLFFCPGEMFEN